MDSTVYLYCVFLIAVSNWCSQAGGIIYLKGGMQRLMWIVGDVTVIL